ncbi:MAG: M48 family metallopeptidase [bacterium]|nr:M48 family metallopeptidase [bacterium]
MTAYCVNCGEQCRARYPFCRACETDPCLPESRIGEALGMGQETSVIDFIYRDERLQLIYAILICTVVSIVLGAFTLSLYFILFAATVLGIRAREYSIRSRCVAVGPHTLPEIDRLRRLAAHRVGIQAPPVYVFQSPVANAYASGFWGDCFIVVNSGLIEMLNHDELLFVLGHEMGHVRYGHTTWMALAYPVQGQHRMFPVTDLLQLLFNAWHLRAEYTADRGGTLAAGFADPGVRTQIKLALGSTLGDEDAINSILTDLEGAADDRFEHIVELFGTHPLPKNRIREIVRFARTDKFREAVGKNSL